jgi:uncharacterized membrane protein
MMNIIVTENERNFNSLERNFFKAGCDLACEAFGTVLEGLDLCLANERDKRKYRHKGKRNTTIKTLMGEVNFSRAVYEYVADEGKKAFVFLLDEYLGVDKIGAISINLAETIAENASVTSFRNTSKNITELTGQSISHAGAWKVVQSLGAKLEQEEKRQIEAKAQGILHPEKEVKVLFEEADGVYINIQGKDRAKDSRKLEMKAAVAYEGWKEVSKDRFELVSKTACVGFESAAAFRKKKEAMLAAIYNLDETEYRILNGDGAAWIRNTADENVIYQLDPFHKHQAIVSKIKNTGHRETVLKLLNENKIDEMLLAIDALANSAEDENQEKKFRELYAYFSENRDYLTPYQQRGIILPSPPEGVVYRNLGTMEHHICDIIAQRMKHRKASWSIQGAENMGRLLALKVCKKLHEALRKFSKTVLPNEQCYEIIEVMSAAKSPKKDGKGSDGNIHKGHIPFSDCAVTDGRKVIKMMFNLRDFYDLVYR